MAGAAVELGRTLGVTEPEHLGQLVNALAVVLTGIVVLVLARVMWPARPRLWLAAVGFYAFRRLLRRQARCSTPSRSECS